MISKRIITALVLPVVAVAMIVVGCSEEQGSKGKTFADAVVDTVSHAIAQNLVEASFVNGVEAPPVVPIDETVRRVTDIVTFNSDAYASFDGGLIHYDLRDRSVEVIEIGERLNAVAVFEGQVYAGGESLWMLNDSVLEPVETAFEGEIRRLCVVGYRLVIGTESGLFARSVFGDEVLFADVVVSALVADYDGLWVGTDGQGLYRWDGSDFKQRYLDRDQTIFDCVNSLAFRNGHLYVGTDQALYHFDGGSWETLTTDNGLPSNCILALDASTWVTFIATDKGIVSLHDGEIGPVGKLESQVAGALSARGSKLLIGTDHSGLLLKTGPTLKTVVEPRIEDTPNELAVTLQ